MDDLEPLFLLEAERLLELGDVRESAELCTRGLEKYPDYSSAYLVLLRSLEAMGDIVQMQEVLTNVPNSIKIRQSVQELLDRHGLRVAEEPNVDITTNTQEDISQVPEAVSLDKEINKAIRDDELKPELIVKLTQKEPITEEQSIEIKETLTLAKIYEQQDAYAEALEIYKQLQEKTEDKSLFADKIVELKALLEE